MTREELMALTHAELKARATEEGIEFPSRANKTELAELIYEKTNHQEGAQEVAQALKESDNDLLNEGDFGIVPGQMIKVITKKDGDVIETQVPIDDVLDPIRFTLNRSAELEAVNDTLKKENERLKHENAELEALAYREVIGHPSQASTEAAVTAIEWDGGDQMTIRARVKPNCGISSRIRGGYDFTLQYQEITVDRALFDVLSGDHYIQIDRVGSRDD
ncbi:hypothetical protein DC081_09090 [Ignatzschineria cameli]|uniref:hypothetical protein n=1 Tax=Ignatzschineria cameli TaxID=2182793 RepID=UPI000D611DD7|nr:hypothetical protein [Ignatzschineria cameli]PWD89594.1 hypothetical protein DC081_09090 [Ignatzschineria cameli]